MPGIIVKRSQEGVTTTVGMLVVFKGKSSHQEGTQVALCFWDAGIVLAMVCTFVSPQNSNVGNLTTKVMLLGNGPIGS